MCLDVAQFQDMWKAGPGNNCWTTSEQVWMKLLLVRNGALVLNLVLEFCIYIHSCVSSTHLIQPSSTTTISITTTTSFTSSTAITTTCGSSTCTLATTSRSTTHRPCCLAPPPRAHWQPQHGCLRGPPAMPTVQACVHTLYYIYRPYNHPHRMCLYSLATSYPMVSRNNLCS